MTNADAPALPPLYADPQPISVGRHGALQVRHPGFRFAAGINATLLTTEEFAVAAGYYPIVFAADGSPLAVLGLRKDRNAMVDADGQWRAGTYIPGYLRRYPFLLARQDKTSVLCIDEKAGWLQLSGGEPLFEGEKPAEAARRALSFCIAYDRQVEASLAFAAALKERDLLVPNRASVVLPGGETLNFSGFQVIDRARFDALPDKVFLAWRAKGWLAHVYAHFMSLERIQNVAQAVVAQERSAA